MSAGRHHPRSPSSIVAQPARPCGLRRSARERALPASGAVILCAGARSAARRHLCVIIAGRFVQGLWRRHFLSALAYVLVSPCVSSGLWARMFDWRAAVWGSRCWRPLVRTASSLINCNCAVLLSRCAVSCVLLRTRLPALPRATPPDHGRIGIRRCASADLPFVGVHVGGRSRPPALTKPA